MTQLVKNFLDTRTEYKKDFNIFSSFSIYDKYFKNFSLPKTVQILGTNGKGSTSRYLAIMLKDAGYKVGHFTSPHLFEFNERFWLNGSIISDDALNSAHLSLAALLKDDLCKLSYFEYACFLAPFVFKDCDFMLLEAGLGGEYDTTSAFKKILSIYTPISKDHEEILGGSLEEIARTKLKAVTSTFILGLNQEASTRQIALNMASLKGVKLIDERKFLKLSYPSVGTNLKALSEQIELLSKLVNESIITKNQKAKALNIDEGLAKKLNSLKQNLVLLEEALPKDEPYQPANKALKKTLKALNSKTKTLPEFLKQNLNLAINAFYFLTNDLPLKAPKLDLAGRCEQISSKITLDVGHNEAAAKAIKAHFKDKKIFLIYNSFLEKDTKRILSFLSPLIKAVYLLRINEPSRPMLNDKLFAICEELGLRCEEFMGIKDDEFYLVFGSFKTVQAFKELYF